MFRESVIRDRGCVFFKIADLAWTRLQLANDLQTDFGDDIQRVLVLLASVVRTKRDAQLSLDDAANYGIRLREYV